MSGVRNKLAVLSLAVLFSLPGCKKKKTTTDDSKTDNQITLSNQSSDWKDALKLFRANKGPLSEVDREKIKASLDKEIIRERNKVVSMAGSKSAGPGYQAKLASLSRYTDALMALRYFLNDYASFAKKGNKELIRATGRMIEELDKTSPASLQSQIRQEIYKLSLTKDLTANQKQVKTGLVILYDQLERPDCFKKLNTKEKIKEIFTNYKSAKLEEAAALLPVHEPKLNSKLRAYYRHVSVFYNELSYPGARDFLRAAEKITSGKVNADTREVQLAREIGALLKPRVQTITRLREQHDARRNESFTNVTDKTLIDARHASFDLEVLNLLYRYPINQINIKYNR